MPSFGSTGGNIKGRKIPGLGTEHLPGALCSGTGSPALAPNPAESREVFPNSTVSLTSQRHPENLPDGLIFETSICYWQDQPGRGSEHGEPGVQPTCRYTGFMPRVGLLGYREKFPNTRKPSHCRICAELWKHRGQHKREGKKKNKQLKIADCVILQGRTLEWGAIAFSNMG